MLRVEMKRRKEKMTQIYLISSARGMGPYKIGRARDPKKRLGELQVGNWIKLELEFAREADERLEKALQWEFGEKRLRGEWFDLDDDEITYAMNCIAFVEEAETAICAYELYLEDERELKEKEAALRSRLGDRR